MAVAKAAPGPQPPLPLHPRQPQPPLHRASSFLPCMAPRPPTGQPSPRTPCSPCTVTTPGTPSLLPCGPPQGSPSPLHPRTLASGCLGVAPCRRAQPIPTVLSSPSLLEKLQLQWQPLGCGALPGGGSARHPWSSWWPGGTGVQGLWWNQSTWGLLEDMGSRSHHGPQVTLCGGPHVQDGFGAGRTPYPCPTHQPA